MKKYLIGTVAFAVAISISAFQSATSPRKPASFRVYWYSYNAGMDQLTGELGYMDHTEAVMTTMCSDLGEFQCARAYDIAQAGPFPMFASPWYIDVTTKAGPDLDQ